MFQIELYPEMDSNRNLNVWTSIYFQFQILSSIDMLQTSKMKISLTPYYSPSWDGTILLYESFKIPSRRKNELKNENGASKAQKLTFAKIFKMIIFLSSDVEPLSGFSTSIKSIDPLTLPDEIYFRSSSIRKWIQIKIWTYEPRFIFHFKSLAS